MVLAFGLCLGCCSCLPTIANLSKGYSVPKAIASHAPVEEEILVLPLWWDSKTDNFHNPYIIPVSAIGTSTADVPKRTGFYIDTYACGEPSKYVVGFLVVLQAGTVVWSDVRGETIFESNGPLKQELTALVSASVVGPGLRKLMQYGTIEIGLIAEDEERALAIRFLEKIPNEPTTKNGI